MTTTTPTYAWFTDAQQVTHLTNVFDLTIDAAPVKITRADLDTSSERIGQNRADERLDPDHVSRMLAHWQDGTPMPRALVWRPPAGRLVIVDGYHRAEMAHQARQPVEALEVHCDELIIREVTLIVNLQHGRTTATPEYIAFVMQLLKEDGVSNAKIGRLMGYTPERVAAITRREDAQDRVQRILGRDVRVAREGTLDVIASLEDAHVEALGRDFLTLKTVEQREMAERIKAAPSAERADLVLEMRGEARELIRQRSKRTAKPSKPATQLQTATTTLTNIANLISAFHQNPDGARAKLRDQWRQLMPRVSEFAAFLLDDPQRKAS